MLYNSFNGSRGGYIYSISILRSVACLGVVMVHLGQRLELHGVIRTFTDFGAMGVYLFFILSGYLFAHSCYSGKTSGTSMVLLKRFIHMLPLYFLVVAVYCIVETFALHEAPSDPYHLYWLRYIFCLNAVVPHPDAYWYNIGMVWTIPVFVFSFVILSVVLKFVNTYKRALVFLGGSLIVAVVAHYLKGWFSAISSLPYFAEGIVLLFAEKEKKTSQLLVILAITEIGLLSVGLSDSLYMTSIAFMLTMIAIRPLQIAEGSKVDIILRRFDRYSYTIYLIQGIIFTLIIDRFQLPRVLIVTVVIVGTAFTSWVVKDFIEEPIQKRLSQLMKTT